MFAWDIMGGIVARNKAGKEAIAHVLGEKAAAAGPADVLLALQKGAAVKQFADAVVFLNNPQRIWEQVDIVQGVWNLRDVFKVGGQVLVLVTTPGSVLPVELQNDVMVIDEPLPSADDLREIIPGMFESAELAPPEASVVDQAVDALVGLAAFPAEQALAMSLSKKGLDVERLWERKRQAVEQAPGLTIWRGGETFADIGGCDNIKRFLSAVLKGQEAPRVVVFVDEIDKAFERVRYAYGDHLASVIHLAAYYDFSGEPSPKYEEMTVRGTERLLNALREFRVEQFVFSSSMLVHAPSEPGRKINEDSPLDPKWDYPKSKIETENLIHAHRGEMPAAILRIAGVYDDQCDSIPIAHQIQRIYERKLISRVFPGNPSHGQPFVHLDDVVGAIASAVDRRAELRNETVLLIGEEETLSYDELQHLLGEADSWGGV